MIEVIKRSTSNAKITQNIFAKASTRSYYFFLTITITINIDNYHYNYIYHNWEKEGQLI